MKIHDVLDIFTGLEKMSKIINVDVNHILGYIGYHDKDIEDLLCNITDKYNEFVNADIVKRGEMLGIKIKQNSKEEKD